MHRGGTVLLDGAHAVGAVPLSVDTLGADYYTSNLHKWACSPKGAAFLWVHPAHHRSLKPLVTSHGYGLVSAPPIPLSAASFQENRPGFKRVFNSSASWVQDAFVGSLPISAPQLQPMQASRLMSN